MDRYPDSDVENAIKIVSQFASVRGLAGDILIAEVRAQRAIIERVRALCDDVDKKYLLVDDNTQPVSPEPKLFLLLDDVREALGDE